MEKQLSLPQELVQPSREVLHRYGNTSSSSIWCSPALLHDALHVFDSVRALHWLQ